MANKVLTVEQIIARGRTEGWTGYGIAKLINAKLAEAGVAPIRPQMVYNYDRQGMVVKGVKGVASERNFTEAEALGFAERFVARKIAKAQEIKDVKVEETIVEAQCEGQEELDLQI